MHFAHAVKLPWPQTITQKQKTTTTNKHVTKQIINAFNCTQNNSWGGFCSFHLWTLCTVPINWFFVLFLLCFCNFDTEFVIVLKLIGIAHVLPFFWQWEKQKQAGWFDVYYCVLLFCFVLFCFVSCSLRLSFLFQKPVMLCRSRLIHSHSSILHPILLSSFTITSYHIHPICTCYHYTNHDRRIHTTIRNGNNNNIHNTKYKIQTNHDTRNDHQQLTKGGGQEEGKGMKRREGEKREEGREGKGREVQQRENEYDVMYVMQYHIIR